MKSLHRWLVIFTNWLYGKPKHLPYGQRILVAKEALNQALWFLGKAQAYYNQANIQRAVNQTHHAMEVLERRFAREHREKARSSKNRPADKTIDKWTANIGLGKIEFIRQPHGELRLCRHGLSECCDCTVIVYQCGGSVLKEIPGCGNQFEKPGSVCQDGRCENCNGSLYIVEVKQAWKTNG
jgi:hypothetical protein